jgi:hypothetical protein
MVELVHLVETCSRIIVWHFAPMVENEDWAVLWPSEFVDFGLKFLYLSNSCEKIAMLFDRQLLGRQVNVVNHGRGENGAADFHRPPDRGDQGTRYLSPLPGDDFACPLKFRKLTGTEAAPAIKIAYLCPLPI